MPQSRTGKLGTMLFGLAVFLGVGFLLVPAAVVFLFATMPEGRTQHVTDWPRFYRQEVSQYFKIPAEAVVVHAEDYSPWPMGQQVTIRFYLPARRAPNQWLRQIAHAPDRGKGGVDRDSYNGPGDMNFVSYDPATGLYEVVYGWD
jgi:hypothetical protein